MNTLIRRNCFETNSSSAHSVSLAGTDKDFVLDTIYPNEKGVIELEIHSFGWEWFKHNDASTKAIYAYLQAKLGGDEAGMQMVIDVIIEQTGADSVVFTDGDDSYIDHQSMGTFYPNDRETLKDFIFNKNSWLFGGNDNSSPEPGFYSVDTYINQNGKIAVKKVKPSHFMAIPLVDMASKKAIFNNQPTADEVMSAIRWMYDYGTVLTKDVILREPEDLTSRIVGDYGKFRRDPNNFEPGYEHKYDPETMTGSIQFLRCESKWEDRNKPENVKWIDFAVKEITE